MPFRTIAAICALFLATQSIAQTDKTLCANLQDPMDNASRSFSRLSQSLVQLDFKPIQSRLESPEREAFEELERRRAALLPYLEAFLYQLEETTLSVRRCAR